MIALSEVGNQNQNSPAPLPDPVVMDQWGIEWSYFAPWTGAHINAIPAAQLQATLGHEDVITLNELPVMPWRVLAPSSGDFDGDGDVDGGDFLTWQRQLGQSGDWDADGNGDGTVDGEDLSLWRGQFGGPPGAVAANAAVPEPTATALAIVAGLMAGEIRRREMGGLYAARSA
ncbi:MAG: hypothetical protein H0T51_20590 [Pirellulales bacterium]|nr:hypothetical protein [Pirellulales bacterium]